MTASLITEPGIYDIPNDAYHARHEALSSSGARKILPPYCPAIFEWEQTHPVRKDVFDFGSAAHKLVLGDRVARLAVIDADSWRTNAAKEARDDARENGLIPILAKDHTILKRMADALRAHPLVGRLFDPSRGEPERSLFWTDQETGVPCKARVDWLPDKTGPRLILPDYKTAESAHPDKFRKSAANLGYHQQAAWYMDGIRALGLDDDPAFIFVAQEKTPPYLVQPIELREPSLNIGRILNRQARHAYAECIATGEWPGYSKGIEQVDLPTWYLREHDEEPEA